MIHILEVVRHGQHGFFLATDNTDNTEGFLFQPRTTLTDRQQEALIVQTNPLVRPPGAQLSYPCYPCYPWRVLSVARVLRGSCIRGPCSSVAQFGGHALTHCPPCVHPDRCPHSRGAQRPEQGTGTAAGLRKVRDARRRSREAGLSPDGRWLAYGINRSNRDNELRVVAGGVRRRPKVVAFGSQATFSADSQWAGLRHRHVGGAGRKAPAAEEADPAQARHVASWPRAT